MRLLKKLPDLLDGVKTKLDTRSYSSVNLYFEDESRFGLMTYIGRCLTAKGVKPLVKFQHTFINTYLYGCFSPINGDSFIYEIQGTSSEIFHKYLMEFSNYKPKELKVLIIDNAGFHSLKNFNLPENIILINIPPYSPELNPAEKIWQYIKQHFKNNFFENLEQLKQWLDEFIINNLNDSIIKSITHNSFYNTTFSNHFDI